MWYIELISYLLSLRYLMAMLKIRYVSHKSQCRYVVHSILLISICVCWFKLRYVLLYDGDVENKRNIAHESL